MPAKWLWFIRHPSSLWSSRKFPLLIFQIAYQSNYIPMAWICIGFRGKVQSANKLAQNCCIDYLWWWCGGIFLLPLFYTGRVVTQKQHNLNAIANADTRVFAQISTWKPLLAYRKNTESTRIHLISVWDGRSEGEWHRGEMEVSLLLRLPSIWMNIKKIGQK